MRLYLDVSCLNRPFDDQSQVRIRLESEAILEILDRCDSGIWSHVSSSIADLEIDAISDQERRRRVRALLPPPSAMMVLSAADYSRAAELGGYGLKPADALHVAAAERWNVDMMLTCDDRLLRTSRRNRRALRVDLANPLAWFQEIQNA